MEEKLKVRCTKGYLIAYDNRISTEWTRLGAHNVNSINLDSITGVKMQVTYAPILFSKGLAKVIIYGKGEQKTDTTMSVPDAKKVVDFVNAIINR